MSWARWRPEIAKAINPDFYSIEGIELAIAEGRSQLWMEPESCVITEIVNYAGGPVCQCLWAAGDLSEIIDRMPGRIEPWAKSQGCIAMLVESRAGWAKALKPIGYEPFSVTVRKAL